jgi:hypothetical protein
VQYGRRIDNGLSVSKRDHDSIVQSIDTDDAGLDTHHDIFIQNFVNCLSAGKQTIAVFRKPGGPVTRMNLGLLLRKTLCGICG